MIHYLSKFALENKVAFITGGAGLIGTEASKALASAGAKTIILDIDRQKARKVTQEILDNGYDIHFEYFDITNLKEIKKNIDKLLKKYKTIDVWINSAYPRTKDWSDGIEHLTLDSWRKNIDMQLSSYAWTSRYVAILMQKKKIKGSIINFGSTYGVVGNDLTIYEGTPIKTDMAYPAIKGGIINLTRYLASYFGKDGIRVNNICPGGVFDNQHKTFVNNYEKKVPLKRMAKAEEIACAVLFLASEASSYVTGETLMVDGGWTIV